MRFIHMKAHHIPRGEAEWDMTCLSVDESHILRPKLQMRILSYGTLLNYVPYCLIFTGLYRTVNDLSERAAFVGTYLLNSF